MIKKPKAQIAKSQFWQQIDKLREGKPEMPDDAWLTTTATLAKTYFGEQSDAYGSARDFDKKSEMWSLDVESVRHHYEARKERALSMVNGFIEMIDQHGLYRAPKKRLFGIPTEGYIIFGLTVAFALGECMSDYKNVELKQTVSKLNDSLERNKEVIDSFRRKLSSIKNPRDSFQADTLSLEPSKEFNSSGIWSLIISGGFSKSENGVKPSYGSKEATLELNQAADKTIAGTFTSHWRQCAAADVQGRVVMDSIKLVITCTKGECMSENGIVVMGKVVNDKVIGEVVSIGEPSGKCILFVGKVIMKRRQ